MIYSLAWVPWPHAIGGQFLGVLGPLPFTIPDFLLGPCCADPSSVPPDQAARSAVGMFFLVRASNEITDPLPGIDCSLPSTSWHQHAMIHHLLHIPCRASVATCLTWRGRASACSCPLPPSSPTFDRMRKDPKSPRDPFHGSHFSRCPPSPGQPKEKLHFPNRHL